MEYFFLKYERKTYSFLFIISGFIILNLIFISCRENVTNQLIRNDIQSDSAVIVSNKSAYYLETDSTILKTDSLGNILGGDLNDWNFSQKNYSDMKKYIFKFRRPFHKNDIIPVPGLADEPFTAENSGNNVILKWFTTSELENKGFYVERNETNNRNDKDHWLELGFIKGNRNSNRENRYQFIDTEVETGATYLYRLKQVSFKNEIDFHSLPGEVFVMKYPGQFEFYPAYPNPVTDKVTFSFYVPKKDVVCLFFLNEKDTTYILDHEPQERGFYKLTIDKKSLGFENEIKRLYINCKTCDKKRNFGDIQF